MAFTHSYRKHVFKFKISMIKSVGIFHGTRRDFSEKSEIVKLFKEEA